MGLQTSLYHWHVGNNGKIVDFSGWDMPVNYGSQIEEHHAVRRSAGMFDVSHMTVVDVTGNEAKAYLQYLLANDVARLDGCGGKALYSGMLNQQGGVIDDLIVYNMANSAGENQWYRTVVNCGTREKDLSWMQLQAEDFSVVLKERADLGMIAVQGPEAIALHAQVANAELVTSIESLEVFQGLAFESGFYARTGYTGEDGLEIMLPAAEIEALWLALVDVGVRPCGLGARDTLRLEAGMNLYGHEMDEPVSPLVANMGWTIAWQPETRNFIGREALLEQKNQGILQKLVGLILRDKGVLRAQQRVLIETSPDAEAEGEGEITSGTFSPTLGCSIALARVPCNIGQHCEVEIRNKRLRVEVVPPCFVRNGQILNEVD